MKTFRMFFFPVILAAVTIAAMGVASDAGNAGFFRPDLKEALYGKWTNTAYWGNNPDHAQKVIFYHWGYCETFNKVDDTVPSAKATFTLVDKWTDAEGNIWYREFRREMGARAARIFFCLDKVSGNETVMESVYEFGDFPLEEDMDPRNPRYRILIRR